MMRSHAAADGGDGGTRERWTVVGADEENLVKGKRGATKLGFALLLKFYTAYGRFPRGRAELPDEAVEHVASQVGVPASALGLYAWSGSTFDYHRKQVRESTRPRARYTGARCARR